MQTCRLLSFLVVALSFLSCRFDEPFSADEHVSLSQQWGGWWTREDSEPQNNIKRIGVLELDGPSDLVLVQLGTDLMLYFEARAYNFEGVTIVSARIVGDRKLPKPFEVVAIERSPKDENVIVVKLLNSSAGVTEFVSPNRLVRSRFEQRKDVFGEPMRFRKDPSNWEGK